MDTGVVPAPELREVAQVWWDVDVAPVVRWRDGGGVFALATETVTDELLLARFDPPPTDPEGVAAVLAGGLAACDFPPTGQRAAPRSVVATLRAAGRPERPVDG